MIDLIDRLQHYRDTTPLLQPFTKLDGKLRPLLGEGSCEQNLERNADDLDILRLGKCCNLLARYS